MNKQQLIDIVKGLLVAGGPIAILLTTVFGVDAGAAQRIVEALAAISSVGGIVWLALGRTDASMVKDAATVKGAQVHVDTRQASEAVVEVARDTTVHDVVPMQGAPRNDAGKLG